MKTKPARHDKTATLRKQRQRDRETAAGFARLSLKVPAEQAEHFKELAAAAVAAKEPRTPHPQE